MFYFAKIFTFVLFSGAYASLSVMPPPESVDPIDPDFGELEPPQVEPQLNAIPPDWPFPPAGYPPFPKPFGVMTQSKIVDSTDSSADNPVDPDKPLDGLNRKLRSVPKNVDQTTETIDAEEVKVNPLIAPNPPVALGRRQHWRRKCLWVRVA